MRRGTTLHESTYESTCEADHETNHEANHEANHESWLGHWRVGIPLARHARTRENRLAAYG